jgi:S1-C subfamily serine protease
MSRHLLALLGLLLGLCPLCAQEDQASRGRPKASLGIVLAEPMSGQQGVSIQQVEPGSPAARAGLRNGDVITRAGSRQIEDYEDLYNALGRYRPGEQLSLRVMRDGQEKNFRVTLGERRFYRSPDEEEQGDEERGQERGRRSGIERGGAYLGVEAVPMEELTARMKKRLGLTNEEGVVIMEVVPDSPAAKAGLHHGDVISRVNGKEITEPQQLRDQVRRTGAGKELTLDILRGEQHRELRARLEEAPAGLRFQEGEGFPGEQFGQGQQQTIQRLQRRIEMLERRLRELEQRQGQGQPSK